jgi:hypothetical protein
MSVIEAEGTLTAVLGTEHTVFTTSTGRYRTLVVDLTNLSSGDSLRLRAKAPVVTGGPERLAREYNFADAQSEANSQSMAFDMSCGGTFTITQTAGTARLFSWHVSGL